MGQTDLSDYKNLYIETTRKTIDNLLVNYGKLANNLQDKEAISGIHIDSHSLKSRSQVMGHNDMANICLNIEKISDDILKRIISADDKFINFLKDAIDKLNLEFVKIEKENAI